MLEFNDNKLDELLGLMEQNGKSSRNRVRIEYNKEYIANIGNVILKQDSYGDPLIIITYKLNISNNQEIDYNVRYPLNEVSRNTKMFELKEVLWALYIDIYAISSNSTSGKELLTNIINAINSKKEVQITFQKEGKPTYYKYRVKRYEEVTSNE